MSNPDNIRTGRFIAVDSLRGIAALSVAIFHLFTPAVEGCTSVLIDFLSGIFQFGYLGVPIFFVISGFVIAASIKPLEVNFRYIGKFIVKRATRLDPPYWLSMALDIGLVYVTIHLFGITTSEPPSAQRVFAHLFYLQDLLGLGNIAANYWTLCLEVQFYIFLSLIFAFSGKIGGADSSARRLFITVIWVITVGYSLLIAGGYVKNLIPGLFLSHWYLFAIGSCCYWAAVSNTVPHKAFALYCILAALLFIVQASKDIYVALNTLSALATALFLFIAANKNKLSEWLNNRVLIYLGSISYSLYLFHAIVGDRFLSFFQKIVFPKFDIEPGSTAIGISLFICALAISILFSHLVFLLIERPSMMISKRIKPNSPSSILGDIREGGGAKTTYAPAN